MSIDESGDRNREIPANAVAGRRTPTFTNSSVPPALLAAHTTATWAQLVVTAGSVEFSDEEPIWETSAEPGRPVTIVPHRAHHIVPAADAEFHVQFYDLADQEPAADDGDYA